MNSFASALATRPGENLPDSRPAPERPRKALKLRRIDAKWLHGLAARIVVDSDMAGGVVFSALRHGEGVTTVICNLAEHVASEFNKRVILIDANFRTPALQDLYGLYGCPGLTEVLSGTATVREAIYGQRDGRIFVMPAGMTNQVDGALLCEEIVPELIAQLRESFDVVLFDTAPLQSYPDGIMLARHASGMVLVVEAERSRWQDGEGILRHLRDSQVNVLGAVLNRRPFYIPNFIYRFL